VSCIWKHSREVTLSLKASSPLIGVYVTSHLISDGENGGWQWFPIFMWLPKAHSLIRMVVRDQLYARPASPGIGSYWLLIVAISRLLTRIN
jgi:hypothetical protein